MTNPKHPTQPTSARDLANRRADLGFLPFPVWKDGKGSMP
jgi:hypothetical protein